MQTTKLSFTKQYEKSFANYCGTEQCRKHTDTNFVNFSFGYMDVTDKQVSWNDH